MIRATLHAVNIVPHKTKPFVFVADDIPFCPGRLSRIPVASWDERPEVDDDSKSRSVGREERRSILARLFPDLARHLENRPIGGCVD
jgi:hypothetical protein